MTSPKPRHTGHGRDVTTWPSSDRWICCTSPEPLQMSQVAGRVPGAQPEPWHTEHSVAVSTVRSLATPVAHSSRVSSIGISASVALPDPGRAGRGTRRHRRRRRRRP